MKVMICDDEAIVRDGLEMLLKLEPDIEIVGVASNGTQAVETTEQENPDLVLMDLKMPCMNGVEATREIRTKCPEVKVLVLTTYDDDEWVLDAIRAGASGYLLKDTPREGLINAIRGTMAGKTYVDPSVASKILERFPGQQKQSRMLITGRLTKREKEILRLLALGSNNEEISKQLYLSVGTVRNHISTILHKMGVSDRTQAAILAIKAGLGRA